MSYLLWPLAHHHGLSGNVLIDGQEKSSLQSDPGTTKTVSCYPDPFLTFPGSNKESLVQDLLRGRWGLESAYAAKPSHAVEEGIYWPKFLRSQHEST